MTDELISKTDVVKIVKSVLSPASSLTNVARARRQMLDQIYELESKPEPHWIPVEHDLPKENYLDDGYVEPSQPVLVYMNYHTCKTSRYWGHRKSKGTSDYVIPDWMDLEEYDGDNVIAWMPLPEPYKEVTECPITEIEESYISRGTLEELKAQCAVPTLEV